MADTSRRNFLLAGLSLAGGGMLPPAIARAAAIEPDVRRGTIEDVAHVVILMQENRSFDHYFGSMAGVRGFGDRFPIPVMGPDGGTRPVWWQADAEGRLVAPFHLSTRQHFDLMRVKGTPHHWEDAQEAWDNGRMNAWAAPKTVRAMGHYRREDLGFQFALAEAFTLCDAYHCSMHAGTNPNRLFLWTGTNDPAGSHGGPAITNSHDNLAELGGWPESYRWTSYTERLQQAGIDWRIYQDMADNFTDNPLAGFHSFRSAHARTPGSDPALLDRGLSTHTLDRFRKDILENRLPQVSYMVAPAALSEHPGPSSPAQGAAYTAEVLDALTANPAVWARTVLFVMYDENDGFFDHVPPPAPPGRRDDEASGASTVSTEGEYHLVPSESAGKSDLPELRGRPYGLGPRVPMFVVSPWSRGGWVNSQVYDHTSVIRFLEARFGVAEPNISPWRRAVCGDLAGCLDFSRAGNAAPAPLPDPRPEAARAALIPKQPVPDAPAHNPPSAQEPGIRRSRALPYHLEVTDAMEDDAITLRFACDGTAAAVFHVYDRLALDKPPRRYTLTPGKTLSGRWLLKDGAHDLWVLGPNGFHRHFTGRPGQTAPRLAWRLDRTAMRLALIVGEGRVEAVSNAYGRQHGNWSGKGGGRHHWDLALTGGWYDISITAPDVPGFSRRIAGRLENGRDSVTDPALAIA